MANFGGKMFGCALNPVLMLFCAINFPFSFFRDLGCGLKWKPFSLPF